MSRKSHGLPLGALLLLGACSGQGTDRFDVSGTVTFNGQPVPAGQVVFSPDLSKGNDGPQGYAEIHGGRYDTRAMRASRTAAEARISLIASASVR